MRLLALAAGCLATTAREGTSPDGSTCRFPVGVLLLGWGLDFRRAISA
jgi:hypothetical protein